jgi:GTP-binding protein EngB required for normal cell division
MPKKEKVEDTEETEETEEKVDYSIKALETEKSKIPLRACQKNGTLPKFPCSVMFSGRSGSGKSNLLASILSRDEMLKDYYHCIVVYSPTAGTTDDIYKNLDLPKENFIPDFGKEDLERIIDSRKKLIKKKGIEWVAKQSRMLIILDDVISNREFLNSPTALKLFALLRHYLCSIFVLMQSYTKLPRALRLNCNCIYVFPASRSEIEVLKDEITPSSLTKKEFEQVIEYCTKDDYSFLTINNHAPSGKKIRKNLDEIINLDEYKMKR